MEVQTLPASKNTSLLSMFAYTRVPWRKKWTTNTWDICFISIVVNLEYIYGTPTEVNKNKDCMKFTLIDFYFHWNNNTSVELNVYFHGGKKKIMEGNTINFMDANPPLTWKFKTCQGTEYSYSHGSTWKSSMKAYMEPWKVKIPPFNGSKKASMEVTFASLTSMEAKTNLYGCNVYLHGSKVKFP